MIGVFDHRCAGGENDRIDVISLLLTPCRIARALKIFAEKAGFDQRLAGSFTVAQISQSSTRDTVELKTWEPLPALLTHDRDQGARVSLAVSDRRTLATTFGLGKETRGHETNCVKHHIGVGL